MTPSEKRRAAYLFEREANETFSEAESVEYGALAAALCAEADSLEHAAGEITPEMVSRWMREAGFTFGIVSSTYPAELHAFATLAFSHGARREREECAKRIYCQIPVRLSAPPGSYALGYDQGLRDAFAAIRARKP